MTCVGCGLSFSDEAAFCPRCGVSQGDPARDRTQRIPLADVRDAACAADGPTDADGVTDLDGSTEPEAVTDPGGVAPVVAALVDCPRCGGRNAGSRVLCGRCGADLRSGRLPPRHGASAPFRDEPTPAGAATDEDGLAAGRNRQGDDRGSRTGAFPLLVTVVVVAALAGGVVGAMAAVRVGPFAAEPQTAPAPSFDPSLHPDEPIELDVATVDASSTHRPLGTVSFEPEQLVDGELTTAWNSNGSGVGETVTVTFPGPVWLMSVGVANGYQRDDARFLGNARVTRALLELTTPTRDPAVVFAVTLVDQRGWQTVEFTEPILTTQLTLEIVELTQGDTYDDLAISELRFRGWPAP